MEHVHLRHQVGIGLRKLVLQPGADGCHLCSGLLDRDPGVQPRDNALVMKYPIRLVGTGRDIDLDRVDGKKESPRHDTDNVARHSAQSNGAAHDVGVTSKQVLPAVVTENDDMVVCRDQVAPENWHHTQHVKDVVVDGQRVENARLTVALQIQFKTILTSFIQTYVVGSA